MAGQDFCDWVIWYADGSSFTSQDGPPEAAPRVGVQVVCMRDDRVGFIPWFNDHFYCWQKDTAGVGYWTPHDYDGMTHYMDTVTPAIRLRGYTIPDSDFQEIYARAIADSRMPPRSGRDVREKAPPN